MVMILMLLWHYDANDEDYDEDDEKAAYQEMIEDFGQKVRQEPEPWRSRTRAFPNTGDI